MFRVLFFSLFFIFYGTTAYPAKIQDAHKKNPAKKTVCLNMIVKNESPVIKRCLASVKKIIDYWVIVDTGSSDGTQEIIKDFMKDIPGKLYELPWKNFAHNRNEALQLAKGYGDYVLFIDADEVLIMPENYHLPELKGDGYLAPVRISEVTDIRIQRGFLIDNHLDWKWVGVLHEELKCSKDPVCDFLTDIIISAVSTDGHRSQDPNKHIKDAKILEEALKDEPNNANYVYYLAQSYFNAREYRLSMEAYAKRATMGGWDQQVFWSKFAVGLCQDLMGLKDDSIKSYCEAYQNRPNRGEPIYRLAENFFEKEDYVISYALAKYGITLPIPQDIIYVERWMYDYGFLYYIGYSALKLKKFEEAREAFEKLLLCKTLPDRVRIEVKKSLVQAQTESFLHQE